MTELVHICREQLEHGFYAGFNALQGHKNTYYVSGLNGFETVEFAIRAGQDVVDSYFDSVYPESEGDAAQHKIDSEL